jgi:hypothetical protein
MAANKFVLKHSTDPEDVTPASAGKSVEVFGGNVPKPVQAVRRGQLGRAVMRGLLWVGCAVAVLAGLWLPAPARAGTGPAHFVGTGTHPWVVVLCNFSDDQATPNTQAYYQQMFSDAGAGQLGQLDYWRDVSFGQLSISGTTVTNWVTARDPSNPGNTLTLGKFSALNRFNQIRACADGADATGSIRWPSYWGVISVYLEPRSKLATGISANSTTITLTSTANFPNGSAPFRLCLGPCYSSNFETVTVTGVSGTTLTIQRGSKPEAWLPGAPVSVPDSEGAPYDGQAGMQLGSGTYPLAAVNLPHDVDTTLASHEMGHGFGLNHSRAMTCAACSTNQPDYWDCTDVMSAGSCVYQFNSSADVGTTFGDGLGGPGLDTVNLDKAGWIPSSREYTFDNSGPDQQTITLHALSDPGALSSGCSPSGCGEFLEARVPASVTVPYGTASQYYTVEYREKSGWDSGFPASAVVLHLWSPTSVDLNDGNGNPDPGVGYWVNVTPQGHSGMLYAGDEYVDATNNMYLAVNAIDPGSHTALITLGSHKINTVLSNLGPTGGSGTEVTLGADLMIPGNDAPVPGGKPVLLSVDSENALIGQVASCTGTTDANGNASCAVNLSPGVYALTASFAGDSAYAPTSASTSFTIGQSAGGIPPGRGPFSPPSHIIFNQASPRPVP